MTITRRLVVAFGLSVAAVGALLFTVYAIGDGTGTGPLQSVSWRLGIYGRKATGRLPDLSWSEVWRMTLRRSGFGLAAIVQQGRSPDGAVANPYVTDEDRRAGADTFRQHCAVCHGADGGGGAAPPLVGRNLRFGNSDLALYKVLRDGVANSSMAPTELSWIERWQVIGYLKSHRRTQPDETDEGSTLSVHVPADALRTAVERPDVWLTYSGSLDGRRYSSLSEIRPENVPGLRIRWVQQFDVPDEPIEATPLVAGGVMFLTVPPASVLALDARTGAVRWRYDRSIPATLPLCCRRVNRGVAILGTLVYFGSLDGYLVAIDANTGQTKWETQVASPADGYTLTGAPLVAGDSVVVGVGGAEFGIQGFLAAFDATTGAMRWRFESIPRPGMAGHETWENDAWKTGGGSTWVTGSYDAAQDLIIWGVGNPAPDFAGDERPGDNLFTNSVVALDAKSGKLAWHFQFTPHDEHDWDSAQTPILADLTINGRVQPVVCWPNRNGFYYVLDRTNGRFITGVAYVEQNWTPGLDASGRPRPLDSRPGSDRGRLVRPGGGGTNWQNAAFDAARSLVFVPATEGASVFTNARQARRAGQGLFLGSWGEATEGPTPVVRALDAATGARRWENYSAPLGGGPRSYSGLLATGGGLVFGASGGSVFALESDTGREVWTASLGGDSRAAPITFTIDGRQVIAVSVGRSMFVFGL